MEKKYAKVEGYVDLVRDIETNAIINTNSQDHKSYVSLRNIKKKEVDRIGCIENDLNQLKSDINEIKFLLRNLSNGS